MYTGISLHHVTKIEFKNPPHELQPGSQLGWARYLTIHDRDGHSTELTLFAEAPESLWLETENVDG